MRFWGRWGCGALGRGSLGGFGVGDGWLVGGCYRGWWGAGVGLGGQRVTRVMQSWRGGRWGGWDEALGLGLAHRRLR